ncbi:M24 family metallopeptidase [Bosea sp. (in: a-proteobacteria)]|uniref:M24 family metallopeptidase n=1 Tax=Bosea sp. (in: a-proteobacteria) TaxID=1871050 RepID=UPI0025B8D8F7|nr:M24 family metallopeptidase [Bosea sp. (in: a-proteobacteria)]MBR3192074.1 aminopeptidase P family protein [Bosea sp. (in: a-proteobacteria)]
MTADATAPVAKPTVPAEEFAERRRRAAAAARARGLAGLLVCSRGGGTLDRYADVLYLTNFYTHFPFIPDFEGNWSARAHTFLILPVDEVPELVIDVPDDGRIRLADGRVTYSDFVLDDAVKALKTAGLGSARIGLVGGDVLTFTMLNKLRAALPELVIEPADDLLMGLRSIKSPAEIALLRRASAIGSRMIEAMMDAAVTGASHGDVVAAGLNYLVPAGGMLYNSFMASGRGGDPSRFAKSNFPTWGSDKRLADGDWIRLGISGAVDGYVFDLARSKAVGPVTNRQVELFESAIASIEATLAAIRPGATAGDLGAAGLDKQKSMGFAVDGVFSAMGHGIGLGWDDPWLARGVATPIVPNMVLSVERTIMQDGYLGDYEESVLITPDGYERLTDATTRFW